MADLDTHGDAVAAYEAAVERAVAMRAAWEDDGSPLLAAGSMGQLVPHPLIKMIQDAEVLAEKLRRGSLGKSHNGPEPRAVVQARIGKAPSSLRSVK